MRLTNTACRFFGIAAFGALLAAPGAAFSATAGSLQDKVRAYCRAHEREIISEYFRFLAQPNVAADVAGLRRNAEFTVAMMKQRGISSRLLEGRKQGVPPVVYGEVKVPGATRTVVFYAHYDGMPVNPAEWAPGWEPFKPNLATAPFNRGGKVIDLAQSTSPINPEWRITGRSSADDKAGIMTLLNAYAAIIESRENPSVNLKFFFDGEEERGSPHLREFLVDHRELLQSDLWIVIDGPRHPLGQKMVLFGVRGDTNVHLSVYGPKRPLHSGHFGNWAPNPAAMLVNLLASMKDDHGRVLIPGFYDDATPLSEAERLAIMAIPNADAELQSELGIAAPEMPGRTLVESLQLPSLNINGIQAANVGAAAANVIPTAARAVLDLRLVPGNDFRRQIEKITTHIRTQGFTVITHEPTDSERVKHPRLIRVETRAGYNAQRTPMELPIARAVLEAVQSTVDYPIVRQPSMGGSLPLIVIEETLGAKILTVPVVNYDSNQHAENENVRVRFLWEGVETCAALMTLR